MNETMDEYNTQPRHLCTIVGDEQYTVLFDDGVMVTAGSGILWCSEHGNLIHYEMDERKCDHDWDGEGPDPTFEAVDMITVIEDSKETLEMAVELYTSRYPEEMVELLNELEE